MFLLNACALVLGSVFLYRLLFKKRLPFPPGPKGYPIMGNLLDMPQSYQWLTFTEMGRKWGEISHLSLFGQSIVVVNSVSAMEEFDKESHIYSGRPVLHMGGELMGYDKNLFLLQYGPHFRSYRKQFTRFFGPGKPIQTVQPIVEEKTRRFLKRLVANREDLNNHLRMKSRGIILRSTYGYDVEDHDDHFMELIERTNSNFFSAAFPGSYLVDQLPFLKLFPEWFPGCGFLSDARRWKLDTIASVEVPFTYTKDQVAAGTAPVSFVSTGLEEENTAPAEYYIHDLKWTAFSMFAGGADSTMSNEYAFFLAMVLYPEVQKKAQAEIDAVVGNDRLPTFADQPRLSYVNAIVSETLRWNAVAPLGAPHTATEDSHINGYFIPKGAMIFANLWNMLHNPEMYPDPFTFNPERYLGDSPQRDPRRIVFGYGRRICPGMYLAEAAMFSCFVSSLAVFSVEKALDQNGVPITPIHESIDRIICHPKPFQYVMKLRSQKAHTLVMDT